MKRKIKFFFQQKHLLILFFVWLITQAFLLNKYGIVITDEAIKYNRGANNFLNHTNFSERKYIFYSVYIFIHVLFIKLGFETIGVYIFQLLFNLIAAFLFYKTVLNIFKDKSIAFLSILLLLVCISWQYWTVCLYTESFFCCLGIIFMYCLFGLNKNIKLKYFYAFLVFSLLIFTRPTGAFFIPVVACLLLYIFIKQKKYFAAFLSAIVFMYGFGFLIYYEINSAASFNFIIPFIEHNVICDIPYDSDGLSTHHYGAGLSAIILYITTNPLEFLHLCFLRFFAFWGLTRSYYSTSHNWLLRLFFYPLYFFAIVGLIRQWKTNAFLIIFCLSTIVIFTISVMLTCDEWSSRFIMPLIPIIILLASYGIITRFKKTTG